MHIIYGVDDNFIPLLSVSISSVLHTMQGETLHFHILSMGCKKENEEKLRHFIEGEGQKISFYELEEKLQELKKRIPGLNTGSFSPATLLRLFIPGVLPKNVTKALYLDADTVVLQSLTPLYATALSENALGMAAEPSIYKSHCRLLGFSEKEPYFNAGMILWNLSYFREQGLEEQCLRYYQLKKGRLTFNDQDILNIVCKGRIKPLPQRYNFFSNYYYFRYKALCENAPWYEKLEKKKGFKRAKAHPVMVHFAGASRPYVRGSGNPYGRAFRYYAENSPFTVEEIKGKELFMLLYRGMNVLSFFFPKLRERIGEAYYRSLCKKMKI